MKREIKFRGKSSRQSKYAGQWVYGNLVVPEEIQGDEVMIVKALSDDASCTYHVDVNSVGQFTGLTDKNGREIYEGDIIKFHFMTSSPSTSELFPTKKFFGEITTNKYNQWTILSDGLEIHIENAIKYGEIIGNIYDNKELLEE